MGLENLRRAIRNRIDKSQATRMQDKVAQDIINKRAKSAMLQERASQAVRIAREREKVFADKQIASIRQKSQANNPIDFLKMTGYGSSNGSSSSKKWNPITGRYS